MGFFKKKADPISERAKTLNQQIAALEAEIKRLSAQPPEENHSASKPSGTTLQKHVDTRGASVQPRLRSTALPHGHSGATIHAQSPAQSTPAPKPPPEPELEDVNPFRGEAEHGKAVTEQHDELGVRTPEGTSLWQRIKNNFRAAPASNPKLLNYLAAGSIHGLRPLRYEKRVARNRFLLLVIVLAVVLWGIVAALMRK
ncbi:MAG TPA: hypothetical protein VK615_00035 [Candidatus Binatia bacterium]|nr:hypothetical protein [Candidatus Binatia bacterium]